MWTERTEITPGQRHRDLPIAKFMVVHGLTAHTYRVAGHARTMLETGLALEAIPLVRLCYESAITAHWIAQNVDGAEAFVNKDLLSRRAAAQTFARARSAVLREGAEDIASREIDLHPTESLPQAWNFEQRCRDLREAGEDAYAYYRIMSWYSHPSSHLADRYLNFDGETVTSLRRDPLESDPDVWLFFLACALVWSGRAVDFLDQDRTHRNHLRRAAMELGIPDVLHLTEAARRRTAAATRQGRRSRRGPRRRRKEGPALDGGYQDGTSDGA